MPMVGFSIIHASCIETGIFNDAILDILFRSWFLYYFLYGNQALSLPRPNSPRTLFLKKKKNALLMQKLECVSIWFCFMNSPAFRRTGKIFHSHYLLSSSFMRVQKLISIIKFISFIPKLHSPVAGLRILWTRLFLHIKRWEIRYFKTHKIYGL